MLIVAICDDDNVFAQKMERMLIESGLNSNTTEFRKYSQGKELLFKCDELGEPDVLFLDIQMEGMDGNETAVKFRERYKGTILIFCSGVCQPSAKSFKVAPFRYLLKQYSDNEMMEELKEIVDVLKTRKIAPLISAKHAGGIVRFRTSDILYITVTTRGTRIFLVENHSFEYVKSPASSRESLTSMHEMLRDFGFEYAHNSYIINLQYVTRRTTTEVELVDGTTLSVSRSKERRFREALAEHLSAKYNNSQAPDNMY